MNCKSFFNYICPQIIKTWQKKFYNLLLYILSFISIYSTLQAIVASKNLSIIQNYLTSYNENNFVNFVEDNIRWKRKLYATKNPFLNQKESYQENLCYIWNIHSPSELCSQERWSRLKFMQKIYLFSKDCDIPAANVRLSELFKFTWTTIKSESVLLVHSEQLRPGIKGQDCILSETHSDKCLSCFKRLHFSLQKVDKAHLAFENTLRRFDCLLATDSSIATRPFSPNGTCIDCKVWYRKWLLVHLVNIWQDPPCINWCYYTQLACPHFGTSKIVDFAGHPAFLCRDLNIPESNSDKTENGVELCNCVHPCDIQRDLLPIQTPFISNYLQIKKNQNILSDYMFYDFYASTEHCLMRRKNCQSKFNLEIRNKINNLDRYKSNKINVVAYQMKKSAKAIKIN